MDGEDHPVVALILERQPDLGAGDESHCLPSWIKTFADKWQANEGVTLSRGATGALLHTLVAARQRARRLVIERDARHGYDHPGSISAEDKSPIIASAGSPPGGIGSGG